MSTDLVVDQEADRPDWTCQRAMAWVIDEAPVPADLAWTLVVIARRAHEDGKGSYQCIPTLAAKTGKSEDQVRRDIKALLDKSLISLGDQTLPERNGVPRGKRPVVYDLAMHLSGPKPSRDSKNPSGRKKQDSVEVGGTPCMDATPGMDARGGMDASSTPCMDATPTPCMDATQTKPLNNPLNNPPSPLPPVDTSAPKIPNPREGGDGEFDSDQEQRINTLIGEILTLRPNDRRWTDKSVRAAIANCLADGKPLDEIERAFPACAVDPNTGSPGRLPLDFYWWALPEAPSRSEQRGSRPDYSTDVGTQPRSSQRGYESPKVNMEPGARTAAWQRRRDANSDVPPGYRRRPDGSLLLVDSRADPRAYDEPL